LNGVSYTRTYLRNLISFRHCHKNFRDLNLTFMSPCIVIIFQYISNKMQHYTIYLRTALHVSGGNTTHHQECKQLHIQHLVFVTPLLLPSAILEEVEQSSNFSTLANVASCWIYIRIFRDLVTTSRC